MNIPKSSILPFGHTGIPTLKAMVDRNDYTAAITEIFRDLKNLPPDAMSQVLKGAALALGNGNGNTTACVHQLRKIGGIPVDRTYTVTFDDPNGDPYRLNLYEQLC